MSLTRGRSLTYGNFVDPINARDIGSAGVVDFDGLKLG
jgi:hypothetical protein